MSFDSFTDLPNKEQVTRKVIERAERAEKGSIIDGKCSNCGTEIPDSQANFCAECDVTFLTDEEIKAKKLELDPHLYN